MPTQTRTGAIASSDPSLLNPTQLAWFAGNGSQGTDAVNQLNALGAAPCQLFSVYNSFYTPAYTDIGQNFSPMNGQGKPLAAGQNVLMSIPLCATGSNPSVPVSGMALSDTLNPTNLAQYGILANKVASAGYNSAIFRPGWECNGGWYGWANQGAAAYVAAFQAVVTEMRNAVPGNNFQFEWNVSGGWAPLTSEQMTPGTPFPDDSSFPSDTWRQNYLRWYPGTDYVDFCGQDTYMGQYSIGLGDTPPNTSAIPYMWDAIVQQAVALGKGWCTSEYGSLFGSNPNVQIGPNATNGDLIIAQFLTDSATVMKGLRPSADWDPTIGGWIAGTPPPPASYQCIFNWTGSGTYMTVGSGGSTAKNSTFYPASDAAYSAAWPA